MDIAEIIERIKGNEAEQAQVVQALSGLPIFKGLMDNKVDALYNTKIGTEVKNIHSQYDADILAILGEGPKLNEDGSKQKTYDYVKQLVGELKTLREKSESLNVDAEIQRLKTELETAKKGSAGEVAEKQIQELKTKIETLKQSYEAQVATKEAELEGFKKSTMIDTAFSGLKFNPDVSEDLKKMVLDSLKNTLVSGCKIGDNGEFIFIDEKGEPILNDSHNVATVQDMISKNGALTSILLKDVPAGGGAPQTGGGSGGTRVVKIAGKDFNGLNLGSGIKTKSDFQKLSEKALIDMGIERVSETWRALETEAYENYKVDLLPTN